MSFKVYELSIKVYLTKDINKEDCSSNLSKLIDNNFLNSEVFKEFHEENKFKLYVFDNLYPIEKDGIYKEGSIYSFRLRTIDESLKDFLEKYLVNSYTKKIKVLTIKTRVIAKKNIDKLYSITPAVCKFQDGYWRKNHSLCEFENRIKSNLIKKYNEFTKEKIDENFQLFDYIEFKNKKPIAINIKSIKLLGDKIEIRICNDELSQLLAYMAIGVGVNELNSRGCGFVNYKYL